MRSEELGVALELNNPKTKVAILLTTRPDHQFIGWAPHYLVADLLPAVAEQLSVKATVVRVNDVAVPAKRRVLVEFTGALPAGLEPMSSSNFQLISP